MSDWLSEVFQLVNLPATLLLLLVLVYWLTVIVGITGLDLWEPDLDLSAEGLEGGSAGWWPGILQFFHLGDVPVTVFGSVFALLYWTGTVLGNHYLNPEWNLALGGVLLVGSMLVSLFATKLLIMPTVPFFRDLNRADRQAVTVGQLARVSSSELTETHGEVTIEQDGPPIVLNARCRGARLARNQIVELMEQDRDAHFWWVRLPKQTG